MSPLPPSRPHPSDSKTNWRDLYRAALLELNPSKMAQRVAEAESFVTARANELFQGGDGNRQESQDLNDALCALRALRLKPSTQADRIVSERRDERHSNWNL